MPSRKSPTRRSSRSRGALAGESVPAPGKAAPNWIQVTLRTDLSEEPIVLASSEKLQRAAMEWRSVVRNRRRWADSKRSREEKDKMALAQLLILGVDREELNRLAEARLIEVSIPFTNEKVGWEARVFPWEYFLSAAARGIRPAASLTVVRHLDCAPGAKPRAPERLLFVESAPGKLPDSFTFDTERRLVTASLSVKENDLSRNENRGALRSRIESADPDVIHLAGFDSHQAAALGVINAREIRDGYLIVGENADTEFIEAIDLARILNSGKSKPALVACNLYNSASRICALSVAEGAAAAIGFQDEFDDNLAELFFCNFYQAWNGSRWNTLAAFQAACQTLREQSVNLRGTGVVLWSRESLLLKKEPAPARRGARGVSTAERERRAPSAPLLAASEAAVKQLRQAKDRRLTPSGESGLLQVDVRPLPELNYSMLHNNREMFDVFKITRERDGRVEGLEVEVTLYVGEHRALYSARHDMPEKLLDLNRDIRIPLLHSAWAHLAERVRTSLAVRVRWEEVEIYHRTFRVTLLPLDQWRDDDRDRVWLPSFVLPRDRAIRGIVSSAQRYLMALRDDPNAGFDGYQSYDPALRANPNDAAEGVDDQVRAIWAALVYENALGYINPPPTYSVLSQRLRPPSEVIEGRRGTCIDTTLLLAACLEYVEIYPIIFLLKGHAFVGYWRHNEYQDEFVRAAIGLPRETGAAEDATPMREEEAVRSVEQYGWFYKQDAYDLVLQFVREGKLMPLESTLLTQRGGFWEAVEEGAKNLRSRSDFDSLVDVSQSRGEVTPIPLA